MTVWQENLRRLLSQKEVLILHGNVRDTGYVKKDGTLVPGLTTLIREVGRELNYHRVTFWGVFFDNTNKGHNPMWSLERIEPLQENIEAQIKDIGSEDREITLLTRWLKEEVTDIKQKTIFVINYIDKITPYNKSAMYPKDTALIITLIQKIIENISDNNRLIMIALQDTMLPLEYYTNSPRVAVMEIPKPDKEERNKYFSKNLSVRDFSHDQIDILSNITDGLYMRDLENILRDVINESFKAKELSATTIKKIGNRYRIGTEEDLWAKLPLSGSEKGLIDSIDAWFKKRVIGQDYAVGEVVKAIKKARAGVVGLASGQASKPKAIFFFAGPSGVGKTYLAKKLAEYLFDTEEAFIRFDMSEFKEEHTTSKMIGAPPGYVGYEKGGILTDAVKSRPFSVILFDEIEKAHPKIMDIFLQILDDGRLTDSRGQTVFFTETVIVFTSNLGTRSTIIRGEDTERERLDKILNENKEGAERAEAVRKHFENSVQEFFMFEISRPELLNRIGPHIIAFNYMDNPEVKRRIIERILQDIASNFKDKFANLGYRLNVSTAGDTKVAEYFFEKYSQSIGQFGGRGSVNVIDYEIGYLLAEQMLLAEMNKLTGVTFEVFIDKGELRCRRS